MSPWKVHETLYRGYPTHKVKYMVIGSSPHGTHIHIPECEYWCEVDSVQAKMYKANAEKIAEIGNSLQHINYNGDTNKEDVLKDILDVLQNHNVCTT